MPNIKENEYSRVSEWNAAGYRGEGIKIGVHELASERINPALYTAYNVISAPQFNWRINDRGLGGHLQNVIDSGLDVGSDFEVHVLGSSPAENLRYCLDNGIMIYTMSTSHNWYDPVTNALEAEFTAAGGVFVCAAGNDGNDGLFGSCSKPNFISVGNVRMGVINGADTPLRAPDSSYSIGTDYLDVMNFGWLELRSGNVRGTSFATPRTAFMIGLSMQRFIAQNGRQPSFKDSFASVVTNCTDIEDEGYDAYTGNGLFRLPSLAAVEPECDVIEMWSGKTTALVNGVPHQLEVAPQLIANRNMVGLRDVADLTGWAVEWNNIEKKVTMTRPRE